MKSEFERHDKIKMGAEDTQSEQKDAERRTRKIELSEYAHADRTM